MPGKYIAYRDKSGNERAIIFGEDTMHSDIRVDGYLLSAGFWVLEKKGIRTFGQSTSLDLESRPDDAYLVVKVMLGKSDLQEMNEIALIHFNASNDASAT